MGFNFDFQESIEFNEIPNILFYSKSSSPVEVGITAAHLVALRLYMLRKMSGRGSFCLLQMRSKERIIASVIHKNDTYSETPCQEF